MALEVAFIQFVIHLKVSAHVNAALVKMSRLCYLLLNLRCDAEVVKADFEAATAIRP